MFKDFETWRVAYYIISYFIGATISYLIQVFYYKKDKWDMKSGFLAALSIMIIISVVIVLVNSPQITLMSGFVLMILWGTCGYWGILLYLVKKKKK